jgi:hypothetical protein
VTAKSVDDGLATLFLKDLFFPLFLKDLFFTGDSNNGG